MMSLETMKSHLENPFVNPLTGCFSRDQDFKKGRDTVMYRVVYRFFKGPITKEKPCVMHLCNNPICWNPAHLITGTHQENADYMKECRRCAYGLKNGSNTHNECLPHGTDHWTVSQPHKKLCGDKHWRSAASRDKFIKVNQLLQSPNPDLDSISKTFDLKKRTMVKLKNGTHWSQIIPGSQS